MAKQLYNLTVCHGKKYGKYILKYNRNNFFNYYLKTLSTSLHQKNIEKCQSNDSHSHKVKTIDDKAKEATLNDMPIEMPNPYERQKHVCILCKYGIKLDYKNPKLLSQFISPFTGQMYEKHITRLCKAQQALLKETIKLSIKTGYMGAMVKSVEFLKDPQLFDPANPIRPHKY